MSEWINYFAADWREEREPPAVSAFFWFQLTNTNQLSSYRSNTHVMWQLMDKVPCRLPGEIVGIFWWINMIFTSSLLANAKLWDTVDFLLLLDEAVAAAVGRTVWQPILTGWPHTASGSFSNLGSLPFAWHNRSKVKRLLHPAPNPGSCCSATLWAGHRMAAPRAHLFHSRPLNIT